MPSDAALMDVLGRVSMCNPPIPRLLGMMTCDEGQISSERLQDALDLALEHTREERLDTSLVSE